MAAKKKVKKKKTFGPKNKRATDAQVYAEFINAIAAGIIKAVELREKRKPNGAIELEYDEEEEVDE